MKKRILLLLFVLINITSSLSAQNIGVNNPTPHASALWDMVSTDKGILIPRMTSAQRVAIVTPATGLLVYDITGNKFMYFDGSAWQSIGNSVSAWSLTGNSGNGPANFIGTTDNQPIQFKINNVKSGYIDNIDGPFTGRNLFLGFQSGFNNSASGFDNVYLGFKSGFSNLDGEFNTAVGSFTLQNSANSYSNTAIGSYAMQNATGIVQSTAVGTGALTTAVTGSYNQVFGYHAMFSTATAGTFNCAYGYETLLNNTASYNCGYGNWSLKLNTTGASNSAFGYSSLYNNNIGNFNSAFGESALAGNTTGNYNCGFGYFSGYSNTTGSNNTGIGTNTLQNNNGNNNLALGHQAGMLRSAYTNCTFVGVLAEANLNNFSNSTAIGYNAVVTASNQVKIGNALVTAIGGAVNWSVISDGRFKNNIKENIPGLPFILALRPVSYNLDVISYLNHVMPNGNVDSLLATENSFNVKSQPRYTGFIAQEVESAAEKTGYDFSGIQKPSNEKDTYAVRYAEFVVPLVKAVQELATANEQLIVSNKELEAKLITINIRMAEIEKRLNDSLKTATSNSIK
jgi:trimeric autotransporter adhesin